jgi:hypothetical protein
VSAGGLAETVLTFAAIVGIGACLCMAGLLTPADARPLNTVIIYVGLPAFVFQAVHGAPLSRSLAGVIAVSWVVFAVLIGLAFVAQRLMRMPRDRAGGFMLAASLGNTGYLGYPLTAALLGSAAVPAAVFSDVFGTVFALVLIGLPLAARFGEHAEGTPNAIKELISFPAVGALVLALALRSVQMPDAVSTGLDVLARVVAPLIMISVGLSLRPRSVLSAGGALTVLVGLKLVLAPLLALAFGSAFLPELPLRVAVLEAGMPSMMLTFVVGERYGLDTDFIAAAIFVTTVASALTLPAVQALVF